MAEFQSLPGFRDFYPEDFGPRQHIFRVWRQAARAFGFAEYDGPVLEPLDLYRAKSGDEIEGQLFSFTDKGGREVALRPEMTPTVCRLVGARAGALKRPIKWYSVAEFYRYERMQKGRGRCFTQFNADLFGEPGPEAEVELIALLVQCFRAFGLTAEDFHVRLSDRNLWFYYLEALGLDEPRIRAMLGAVDKFEKMGDDAFRAYAEKFGPLEAALKAQVLAFLQIKSLAALGEHVACAPPTAAAGAGGEADRAPRGLAKSCSATWARWGSSPSSPSTWGSCADWPITPDSSSRLLTARANCARWRAAAATTTWWASSAERNCRRPVSRSAT